jgi:glycosyltransferase involved in cell wall biosynthesis
MSPDLIDIIIPARGEHTNIGNCLAGILSAARNTDLRVIVVTNGPDWELTASIAGESAGAFADHGHELCVMHNPTAGKAEALNLGDRFRRGGPVVYLDADVRLHPEALCALADALRHPEPALAAPRLCVSPARTRIARQFARVWANLPAVRDDVVGAGCYAVNASGRARWEAFPDLAADDAFVRSRFVRSERKVLPDVAFEVQLPEWPELPVAVRRWREGNKQLRRVAPQDRDRQNSDPGASPKANLGWLASRPDLWGSLPGFLAVWLSSYIRARGCGSSSWAPLRPRAQI